LIVVDASVVTDFLIGRDEAIEALHDVLAGRDHEPLYAPELIEPEILNALRGLARGGGLSDERATEAITDLAKLRLTRYPHAPLRARVWSLRHELTAYDALYLALAEALDDPVLVTGDRGLAGRARDSLGADRVIQVA
jgi:predicted nucleic acid-binding protein